MHGRHIGQAKCLHIILGGVMQRLLASHARDGATPSKWPTETALVVVVGHRDGVVQAFILEQMHRGKSLCAGEF